MAESASGPLSYIPEPPEARRIGLVPLVVAGCAVIVLFFAGLGGWSALAVLKSAALAPGVVVVESSRKTVKHLEGGIVAEILVAEGQRVAAGDLLIRLDATQAQAKLEQLQSALLSDEMAAARLRAERDGLTQIPWPPQSTEKSVNPARIDDLKASQEKLFRARQASRAGQAAILKQKVAQSREEISGLRGAIRSQERELSLLDEQIADYTKLLKKGLVDKPRVLEVKRRQAEIAGDRLKNEAAIARAEQVIAEAEIRVAELETERVNTAADELQALEREMPQLREQIAAARDVVRRIDIRAPLGGRVVDLKVHTPGGVIGDGEPLLDIVPDYERLLVDAEIDPGDIDVVRAGQTAEVRFTAFHQRELRPLKARLMSISADRLVDERTGRAYYLGRIELLEDPSAVLKEAEVLPGMQAEAIILTGESTLLGYLRRPIERTFERALRED
jgi:HlyD family type I secretion membrane fusion protein